MRIIKLGPREFSKIEQVEEFFQDTLPNRRPRGKFRLRSLSIGKTRLSKGEQLLFAFNGRICFSALAASARMVNHDKKSSDYPFYFLIDLRSLARERNGLSLNKIEEILSHNGITKSVVKSQKWPVIEDQSVADEIWELTNRSDLRVDEPETKKYGHGGEGVEHKRLKEWIAKHPESIGIENVRATEVEHRYLSGDSVDILFELTTNTDVVVEIETTDALPGCHQAIKYRALRCAEKGLPLSSADVEAIIVAWKIPADVVDFCKKYSIRPVEKRI